MRLFEGTEFDRPPKCNRCGELESNCQCPPLPPKKIPPEKQSLRIQVEKRKKGKVVTVVRDVDELDLADLVVNLKNACGAGGTIKETQIEIQGNHLERIKDLLKAIGYRIRH